MGDEERNLSDCVSCGHFKTERGFIQHREHFEMQIQNLFQFHLLLFSECLMSFCNKRRKTD